LAGGSAKLTPVQGESQPPQPGNLAGHRIRRKVLEDSPASVTSPPYHPALLRKAQVTTRIIFPGPHRSAASAGDSRACTASYIWAAQNGGVRVSRFVLIPGAGGAAWYWHLVVAELRARGHDAVALDLPAADEHAGLPEYADAVIAAIGGHEDAVVVA